MFDGNWRGAVDRSLTPIGHSLRRLGLTPDVVTISGIVLATIAAITIGAGFLRLGLLFLLLTGICDALDGAVARAANSGSGRGAYFDSVSDRYTDAVLFGGVAWHLATTQPGRIMMLPVAIMAVAMFVSYQRAKAESLGYEAKGGIMERAERVIMLAVALLFPEILIPVLWIMLTLTSATALQRFVKVWKQASVGRPQTTKWQRRQPRPPRRRPNRRNDIAWVQRMRERNKAWREG